MVHQWVYDRPDFAAQLKTIPQTKFRSALRQGLKLDLMYEADEKQIWMVHYALLDSEGNCLPQYTVCEGEVKAYFRVVDSELRLTVHKQRIQPRTRFYVVIGPVKIAEGVVTEVLGLLNEG